MTTPHAAADRATTLLGVWAGTLVMLLAATWRLWTPWRGTPRIAPLEVIERVPPAIDFALLALVAYGLLRTLCYVSTSKSMASPRRESGEGSGYAGSSPDLRRGLAAFRGGVLIATGALIGLMLLDQLRWQPWAYHAALAGVILANSTPSQAIGLLRVITVAVYAYSALAKLDAEFAATLGRQMLDAVGLELSDWSDSGCSALVLGIPAVELGVAALLAVSLRARRFGKAACLAAVAMHAATIAVLGPWALGHSLGVLLWNVGFAAQTVALFWRMGEEPAPLAERPPLLALLATCLAVVAPAFTPLGLWDQWPGWALYAPRGERATLFIHTASVERLPKSLQPHVDEAGEGPWRRVRLDEWALAEAAAPIYPQNRIVAAMGLGLLERYPLTGRVRLVEESGCWPLSRKRLVVEHSDTRGVADAARLFGWGPGITWTY